MRIRPREAVRSYTAAMRGVRLIITAALSGGLAGWLAARRRGIAEGTSPEAEPQSVATSHDRPGVWRRLSPATRAVTATVALLAAATATVLTVLQIRDTVAPKAADEDDFVIAAAWISSIQIVGADGYAFEAGEKLPGTSRSGQCDDATYAFLGEADAPQTNPTTRFVLTNRFDGTAAQGQLFVYDIRLQVETTDDPQHVVEFNCPNAGEGSMDYLAADVTKAPKAMYLADFLYGGDERHGAPVYVVAPGETVTFSVTTTSDQDASVRILASVRSGDGRAWDVDLTESFGPVTIAGTSSIQAVLEPGTEVDPEGRPTYFCEDAVGGGFSGECSFTDDEAPDVEDFRELRIEQSTATEVLTVGGS